MRALTLKRMKYYPIIFPPFISLDGEINHECANRASIHNLLSRISSAINLKKIRSKKKKKKIVTLVCGSFEFRQWRDDESGRIKPN